jgi:hypothetical protein
MAMRITMVNDWSSATGFSFRLDYAKEKQPGEELIIQDGPSARRGPRALARALAPSPALILPPPCERAGARVFVESQALFNTETGLLGSTLDMDEDLEITIIPPAPRSSPS